MIYGPIILEVQMFVDIITVTKYDNCVCWQLVFRQLSNN